MLFLHRSEWHSYSGLHSVCDVFLEGFEPHGINNKLGILFSYEILNQLIYSTIYKSVCMWYAWMWTFKLGWILVINHQLSRFYQCFCFVFPLYLHSAYCEHLPYFSDRFGLQLGFFRVKNLTLPSSGGTISHACLMDDPGIILYVYHCVLEVLEKAPRSHTYRYSVTILL